ncbi:hypothetical protein LINPERHAP2_LOCUS2661, partial [Linum perenne]
MFRLTLSVRDFVIILKLVFFWIFVIGWILDFEYWRRFRFALGLCFNSIFNVNSPFIL